MSWINERANKSSALPDQPTRQALIDLLIHQVYELVSGNEVDSNRHRRQLLAASFDLVVAAEYYGVVSGKR